MGTGTLIPNAQAGGFGTRSKDVRVVMQQFAGCTYRRSPARVELMLSLPFGGPDYRRMFESLVVDDCLGAGELSFSGLLLRGYLFEQLYRHYFKRDGPDELLKTPPINYMAGYPTPLPSESIDAIALGQFGDCVTRSDGKDAKQLVLSDPDGSAETAAITGLAPHLGACVPAGQQVRFSKSTLRAGVTEELYKLSRASQQSTSAP